MSQNQGIYKYLELRVVGEPLYFRKRICALEAMFQLQQAGRTPTLPLEFTSQYGEDCFLWELFRGQVDGSFIEVGAYDGYSYSVTYPFEAIGWKGLLVEPIPARFETCKALRTGSRVVHAALSTAGSKGTCSFSIAGAEGPDMLSYLVPTLQHSKEVAAAGAKVQTVTVPLTCMNDLLADHKGPIDFAVIDVEGAEIPLLQGFDLERFRPRALLIEEGPPNQASPVPAYLSKFPYTAVAHPWINRLYIRNDEKDLIQRALRIPIW